jgi:hypothetical protein
MMSAQLVRSPTFLPPLIVESFDDLHLQAQNLGRGSRLRPGDKGVIACGLMTPKKSASAGALSKPPNHLI